MAQQSGFACCESNLERCDASTKCVDNMHVLPWFSRVCLTGFALITPATALMAYFIGYRRGAVNASVIALGWGIYSFSSDAPSGLLMVLTLKYTVFRFCLEITSRS